MKNYTKFLTGILYLIFSFNGSLFSQFSVLEENCLEDIKQGTTYVIMENPDSEEAKAFKDIFRKNWTLSKIDFITEKDVNKYIKEHNYFFEYTGTTITTYMNSMTEPSYSNSYTFFRLWTASSKYLKSNKKKFEEKDMTIAAFFMLHPTANYLTKMADPKSVNNDLYGDFVNKPTVRIWSPGVLQNYLQNVVKLIEQKGKRGLYDDEVIADELVNLEKETLYIPNTILSKYNNFNGTETEKHIEAELMKDYPFKYQYLSISELNEKIINEETPFYYLIYVRSSTHQYFYVMNAKTGKISYSKFTVFSYNIKAKDFKLLAKEILKSSKIKNSKK